MGPRCWSARAARFQKKESEDEDDWRYVHQFSVAWHNRETSFVFTFSGFFAENGVCNFSQRRDMFRPSFVFFLHPPVFVFVFDLKC